MNDIKNDKLKKNIILDNIDNKNDNIDKNDIIDKYIKNINDLNSKVNILIEEIDILKKKEIDNNLRYQAEIDNIIKRNKIEIDKIYKFSLEDFMKELIIFIDNFERSLDIVLIKLDSNLKEGLELTFKSLIKIINKFGLYSISDINIPFDPSIHQAILVSSSKEYNPNYVISIIQKGYLLNNRVIRPAMVQVSSNLEENNIEKNININNNL